MQENFSPLSADEKLESKHSSTLTVNFSRKHPEGKIDNPVEQQLLARFAKYNGSPNDIEDSHRAYERLLTKQLSLPALYQFINLCYGFWLQHLPTRSEFTAAKATVSRLEPELKALANKRLLYRNTEKPVRYYWASPIEHPQAKLTAGTFYQCLPSFELPPNEKSTTMIHIFGELSEPTLRKKLEELEQAKDILQRAQERDNIFKLSAQLYKRAELEPIEQLTSDYHIAMLLQKRGFVEQIPNNSVDTAGYYFSRLAGKTAFNPWHTPSTSLPPNFIESIENLRQLLEEQLYIFWQEKITQWQHEEFENKSNSFQAAFAAVRKFPFVLTPELQELIKDAGKQDWAGTAPIMQHLSLILQDFVPTALQTYTPALISLIHEFSKASADQKHRFLARIESSLQGLALLAFQNLMNSFSDILNKCQKSEPKKKFVENLTTIFSQGTSDDHYRVALQGVLNKLCQFPQAENYAGELAWSIASLNKFALHNIKYWHELGEEKLSKAQCAYYIRQLTEQQKKLQKYISQISDNQWLETTLTAINSALHEAEHLEILLDKPPTVPMQKPHKSQWAEREKMLKEWHHDSLALIEDRKSTLTLLEKNTQKAHDFMKHICEEIEAQLGTPPCEFAIFLLGSGSRREVSFCSDIDFAILVSNDELAGTTYFPAFDELAGTPYFPAFLELLNFKFSVLPKGILPLETNKLPAQKIQKFWIASPKELANRHFFVPVSIHNQTEWDFPVRWPSLVYKSTHNSPAAQELWNSYQRKMSRFFRSRDSNNIPNHLRTEPITLNALLSKNQADIAYGFTSGVIQEEKISIKKENLKAPASTISNAILCYGRYMGIENVSDVQSMLKALIEQKAFPELFLRRIAAALIDLQHWRLRLHRALLEQGSTTEEYDDILLWPVPEGTLFGLYLDNKETQRLKEIDSQIIQVIKGSLAGFMTSIPQKPFQAVEQKSNKMLPGSPISSGSPTSPGSSMSSPKKPLSKQIEAKSDSAFFNPLISAIETTLYDLNKTTRTGEIFALTPKEHEHIHWIAQLIEDYADQLPSIQGAPAPIKEQNIFSYHWAICEQLPNQFRSYYLNYLSKKTGESQTIPFTSSLLPDETQFQPLPNSKPSAFYRDTQYIDIQIFEEKISKRKWIGKCGVMAILTPSEDEPSTHGRYFNEYKEWLGLTLYRFIGIDTGEVCLSLQKAIRPKTQTLPDLDYDHPVMHVMIQEKEDNSPYGPSFMANYSQHTRTNNSATYQVQPYTGTAVPLRGFGTLLVGACFLYDTECVGTQGNNITYSLEIDAGGHTIAKTRKHNASCVFKFLDSDFRPAFGHDPRTRRTIHWSKTETIRFDDLTKADQAEFISALYKLAQAPVTLLKNIIDQTIAPEGLTRAQAERLITELLARRSKMIEAYLPELILYANSQSKQALRVISTRTTKDEMKTESKKEVSASDPIFTSTPNVQFFPSSSSSSITTQNDPSLTPQETSSETQDSTRPGNPQLIPNNSESTLTL